MSKQFDFQYCQKLVILSNDKTSVLLAKRKNEKDYNNLYSFIGGKMETTDGSFLDGMKREKNEEIGKNVRVKVYPTVTSNFLYSKKNGKQMVLPHTAGYFVEGEIILSDEYSNYKWVPLDELREFEPKIENIEEMVFWAREILQQVNEEDLVEI